MNNINYNHQGGNHNEDSNWHISHSLQKEFVYWHAPRSSFPVPSLPTSSHFSSSSSSVVHTKTSLSNRSKDEAILVEQLPSPIESSVPIRKSTMRPKMGLGSRGGFIVSTPKEPGFSKRVSPRKLGNPIVQAEVQEAVVVEEKTLGEDEDEPIYCEIARGDNSPPAKTPPSIIKHRHNQHQPPVQRRNHPTTKRTIYNNNKNNKHETSPAKNKEPSTSSSSSSNAKQRNQEKRLARDFSQLQLIQPSSSPRGLPSSDEFRSEGGVTNQQRQRRISCDLSSQESSNLGGGLPSMAPNLLPPSLYHIAPGGRPVLGLGRRAVTQVDIPLANRHYPPHHLVNHHRPGPTAFQAPHLIHGHPLSAMAPPAAQGVGPLFTTVRKHQQIRNSTAAVAVKRSRQQCSGNGWSASSAPLGACGALSDSEYSRRPMPSVSPASPLMGSRRPLMLHQKALHGECPNENGFNSGLDETNSTTTAAETGTMGSTNMAITHATALRKGLLWQQRDKIFSRWKERFFILTPDYLQCFKKGTSRMTEMGGFIFKLKLAEIEEVELVDKKGYLTVALSFHKEGRILLRKPEGIREWFQSIKNCVDICREKRGMMKTAKEFWSKKQFTDSSSMEQYILARKRIELKYAYSETGSCTSDSKFPNIGQQLRDQSRSNLNLARRNPAIPPSSTSTATATTTTTTTDYGFIDLPNSRQNGTGSISPDLQPSHLVDELESRSSISPTSSSAGFRLKKMARDTSSTFSHDSGVDSMNTISSGSVLSNQVPTYSSNKISPSICKNEKSTTPSNVQTPRKSFIPRHKPVTGVRPNREEMLRNISLV